MKSDDFLQNKFYMRLILYVGFVLNMPLISNQYQFISDCSLAAIVWSTASYPIYLSCFILIQIMSKQSWHALLDYSRILYLEGYGDISVYIYLVTLFTVYFWNVIYITISNKI